VVGADCGRLWRQRCRSCGTWRGNSVGRRSSRGEGAGWDSVGECGRTDGTHEYTPSPDQSGCIHTTADVQATITEMHLRCVTSRRCGWIVAQYVYNAYAVQE
jgi:hypothetical protein